MKRLVISLFSVLFLVISCGKKEPPSDYPDDEIIAKVGNHMITATEFKLNYEFGPAQLKKGENPKRAYLNAMIDELLLANEGYTLRLDTTRHIQQAVQTITEERLIEEVFNRKVLEEIEISPDEIKNEINKAAVSFQFRFIPAQSEPHALFLKQEIEDKGVDSVLAHLKNDIPGQDLSLENLTSPYMSYTDIDPALLEEIKDLELRQPSDPVQYRGQWYVFMVHNIKRERIAPGDYINKEPTFRKVLYNKKAMNQAGEFISGLMEPADVTTKRAVFEQLNRAMYEWYSQDIPSGYLWKKVLKERNTKGKEFLLNVYSIRDETLVEFSGQSWTVQEFLEAFNSSRYPLRPDSYEQFTSRFADIIALVVRDRKLLKMAENENMDTDQDVRREILQWKNKWVFQEIRKRILDTLAFDEASVRSFFESRKSEYPEKLQKVDYTRISEAAKDQIKKDYLTYSLRQKASSLRSTYPVIIYEDVLSDIETSASEKNPNMTVQLFKQNSNRMAIPIADPNW